MDTRGNTRNSRLADLGATERNPLWMRVLPLVCFWVLGVAFGALLVTAAWKGNPATWCPVFCPVRAVVWRI